MTEKILNDFFKKNKILASVISIAVLLLIISTVINHKPLNSKLDKVNSSITEKNNNLELTEEIDLIFETLLTIHYVSITDQQFNDPNNTIIDSLQESMNDSNKLKGVLYKIENIINSKNEIISMTGLVLKNTVLSLLAANEVWINYLRGIDVTGNDFKLSEFQYQMSLFTSSNHDAYLKLLEGASMLPMVTVEFAKEKDNQNTINENIERHFLIEINDLFSDVLIDNEKYYQETKNRYAVAVLIQGYKDFFNK